MYDSLRKPTGIALLHKFTNKFCKLGYQSWQLIDNQVYSKSDLLKVPTSSAVDSFLNVIYGKATL